jgi:hypothetical protein
MVSLRRENQGSLKVSIWILVLTNLLVFQLSGLYFQQPADYRLAESSEITGTLTTYTPATQGAAFPNPLDIPRGKAVALPSVIIDDSKVVYERKIYGGKGDKPHLGGFATGSIDMDGVAPVLWKYMVSEIGVKSLLDIGCGRGISTSWFHLHGVETLCVEGSHDAVGQTVLPPGMVTEHDFSRGPWWPSRTVDAVWCVELLEHVGRNFHENLIPAFRKAALVYATHSTWGGWHHVEVHDSDWWIQKFESLGFRYSDSLTKKAREKATQGRSDMAPNGLAYKAQHLWLHMLVSFKYLPYICVLICFDLI